MASSQFWQDDSHFLNVTGYLNNSQNSSTPVKSGTTLRPAWYWVLRGILAFVTVTGNGLVIYIICSRRRLRSQPSPNWFILSLAVADFLVGVFNAPSLFFYSFYVKANSVLWTAFEFIWNFLLIASTTNICALTLDRYIAVLHPFRHMSFATASSCLITISIAWILPVLQRIPFLVLKLKNTPKDEYFVYQIFYICFFIFLPNVFLLYAYIRIIIVVKKHRKEINSQVVQESSESAITRDCTSNQSRNETATRRRSSLKCTIAVGVVVVIFLVCNGFVQYWLMCHYLFPECKESESTQSFYAMVMLRYFNSAPNFFVYSLIKSDFKRELKNMFKFL